MPPIYRPESMRLIVPGALSVIMGIWEVINGAYAARTAQRAQSSNVAFNSI